MASTSEVGHAKNIANLKLLNTEIAALGAQYNPSSVKLKLNNLLALHAAADANQDMVSSLIGPKKLAVKQRQAEFKINQNLVGLRKAYKATEDVTTAQLDDLMTIIRKLRGDSATSTEQGSEHSTSQQSFDQITNQMGLLISQLESTPNYAPNEEDYKVVYYENKKASMLAKTQAVNDAETSLTTAITIRNQHMYFAPDNMVDIAKKAKDYLLSILPTTSNTYKAIKALKFTKIKP